MRELIADLDSELSSGWVDIVDWLRSQNDVEDIAYRLRWGQIDRVIEGLQEAAERFADDTHAAFNTAAQHTRDWLDKEVDQRLFTYNTGNPRAARWAAGNRYDTVRQMTADQRGMIRAVQMDGVQRGDNPLVTARRIREGIGLTDHQESIVNGYRRKLEEQRYNDALSVRLGDGRSERTIARAMDAGEAMTPEQIDRAVERYRENWITYRSETIARTEGLRVAHQGTDEMYRQAIENGQLRRDELIATWRAGPPTGDFREQHQAMDGQERELDQPFQAPDGTLLFYPCDPNAPIEHTANCRCTRTIRFRPPAAMDPNRAPISVAS